MTLTDGDFSALAEDRDIKEVPVALSKIDAARAHFHGHGADMDHAQAITLIGEVVDEAITQIKAGDLNATDVLIEADRFLDDVIEHDSSRVSIDPAHVDAARRIQQKVDNTLSYAHEWAQGPTHAPEM